MPKVSIVVVMTTSFCGPDTSTKRSRTLFESYLPRPAASVCVSFSDRMVFGIHVDAGADSAFSADPQDTLCAE